MRWGFIYYPRFRQSAKRRCHSDGSNGSCAQNPAAHSLHWHAGARPHVPRQRRPGARFQENATHFDEICGGNALNAAIGIVRLGGRASICGPMGDAREASSRFIFEELAHEGIETRDIIHMPGLVTPSRPSWWIPAAQRTIAPLP